MRLINYLEAFFMHEDQLAEESNQRQGLKPFDLCDLEHVKQPIQSLVCHLKKLSIEVGVELHFLPEFRIVIKPDAFLLELIPQELQDDLQGIHKQLTVGNTFRDEFFYRLIVA